MRAVLTHRSLHHPVGAVLLLLAACPKQDPVAPAADSVPAEEPARESKHPVLSAGLNDGGWDKQDVDFNGDGKPEIINWVQGTSVRKKEADLNRDGHMDVITWFDGAGTIEAEEMDGDFDGRIDWVDHYRGGVRFKAEADVDFDGRVDVVFNYAPDGTVTSKERL